MKLNPEHGAINAAVWGPHAHAYLDELEAAVFLDLDPWWSATRDAVVKILRTQDVLGIGFDPGILASQVAEELDQEGHDFTRLGMSAVTAAGGRVHALGIYLQAMAECQLRARLRGDLARMAEALDRPGGPQRVAKLIGVR